MLAADFLGSQADIINSCFKTLILLKHGKMSSISPVDIDKTKK